MRSWKDFGQIWRSLAKSEVGDGERSLTGRPGARRRSGGREAPGAESSRSRPASQAERTVTHGGRRPNSGSWPQSFQRSGGAPAQRQRSLDLQILVGFGVVLGSELDQFGQALFNPIDFLIFFADGYETWPNRKRSVVWPGLPYSTCLCQLLGHFRLKQTQK